MTRGRENNVAHLVAETVEDARQQWIAVFGRDRADLGPAHAAQLAAREAERYAAQRPLDEVLAELRQAWTVEANTQARLIDARQRRDLLRDVVVVSEQRDAVLPELHRAYRAAHAAADCSAARLQQLEPLVVTYAADLAANLVADWDAQRQPAREAAQTVLHGTGRLGQRRGAVLDARDELQQWSAQWRPYVPSMPTSIDQVVRFAAWFDDTPRHHGHFDDYARTAAEQAHPEYSTVRQATHEAREVERANLRTLRQSQQHYSIALQHYGALGHVDDPAGRLADAELAIAVDETTLANARDRIAVLRAEPTLRAKPGEVVDLAQADWAATLEERAVSRAVRAGIERERATTADTRRPSSVPSFPVHETGPSISR